jgi:hypothetical protein
MASPEEFLLLPVEDSSNYTSEKLSTELFQQHRDDIARRREANISTTFVIPENRLVPPPDSARTVEILTGHKILYNGEVTSFKDLDAMTLNVLFAEEGALSLNGIMHRLNFHTTPQRDAIVRIMNKSHSIKSGSFVKIEEDQDDLTYQIDPEVAFIDRRKRMSRAEVIKSLVKQYRNDPQVQSAETVLFRSGPKYAGKNGYDSVKLESLGEIGENELLDVLNDVIERHSRGEATPDEQRDGTIAFNKLVYSLLPFARYMVLESAGQITGRRRTPLSGFLRRFSEDHLSRSVEDALQFAAIGVVKAIQNFDIAKGDLFPHVAMTVSFEVRSGILDTVRHVWGHTKTDIKENKKGRVRRSIVQSEEDYELLFSTTESIEAEKDYERVLSVMTARQVVRSAMRHPDLRPIDQLILSLSTGVYLEEFEGRSFKGGGGRVFLYDQHLLSNPIFREGVADSAIANFLRTSTSTVYRVRKNALKLLEDALRQRTSQKYYRDKWQDTFDWLD